MYEKIRKNKTRVQRNKSKINETEERLRQLKNREKKNLVERFIKENLTSQGLIVDYAIYDENQDKNE